jgi:hypothetical protein
MRTPPMPGEKKGRRATINSLTVSFLRFLGGVADPENIDADPHTDSFFYILMIDMILRIFLLAFPAFPLPGSFSCPS